MTHQHFQSCIEACTQCALACEHCAEACLNELNVSDMSECIRLDRDCAAICWLASSFMSRDSKFAHEVCAICADICEECGAECERHDHDHCQRCAEACHHCARECQQMAGAAV